LLLMCSFAQLVAAPVTSSSMVRLPGGVFLMGTQDGEEEGEGPIHEVKLGPFWIDKTEVTVGEFARFVEATGHKTAAEKDGSSKAYNLDVGKWVQTPGATWRHPEGAEGGAARANDPVVQVSWEDAKAYANWTGKRLPTEAEWEFAARGGLGQARFAWGNELLPNGKYLANWYQGEWRKNNTADDGFSGRAPVGSYPPNGFGLNDMTGNVWEWVADRHSFEYFSVSPADDPHGPTTGTERVVRGGSYLCDDSTCKGYRVASRKSHVPDTGLNNIGFRCAADDSSTSTLSQLSGIN